MFDTEEQTLCRLLGELEDYRVRVLESVPARSIPLPASYAKRIGRLKDKSVHSDRGAAYYVARRVAIFVLVFILAATGGTTVYAASDSVIAFFTELWGTWYNVDYDDTAIQDAPRTIEQVYFPEYVPEGYVLDWHNQFMLMANAQWRNEDGAVMSFAQITLQSDYYKRAEGTQEIRIGERRVLAQRLEDYYAYYWNTDEYAFLLSFWEDIPIEEVEKIMDSLVIIELEKEDGRE